VEGGALVSARGFDERDGDPRSDGAVGLEVLAYWTRPRWMDAPPFRDSARAGSAGAPVVPLAGLVAYHYLKTGFPAG